MGPITQEQIDRSLLNGIRDFITRKDTNSECGVGWPKTEFHVQVKVKEHLPRLEAAGKIRYDAKQDRYFVVE